MPSVSAALSWAEAQLCAFQVSLYTLASLSAGLLATTFQEFLTTHGCLWKSGPAWSTRCVICHSLPTPWIWRWNFWLSNEWLPPYVPCLINSLFTCCSRACNVVGMFSILRFCANNCFLAPFTWLSDDVRWYKRTTYLSISFKSSGDTWLGARANREKTVARWGILHQTAQAVFFPIPWNAETVSHPDNAYINRRPPWSSITQFFRN